MDTTPRLGDSDNNLLFKIAQALDDGAVSGITEVAADARYVLKAGDTMTGALVLPSGSEKLKLGGSSSSFPALGNSSAVAQFKLADDSNFASLDAGLITSQTGGMVMNTVDSASIFAYTFALKKRGTTGDATAAVTSGSEVGNVNWQSWNGSAYVSNASIVVKTDEAQSSGHAGGHIELRTVEVGSAVGAARVTIGNGQTLFSLLPVNIATTSSLQLNGVAYHNPLSVYASGTVYTLTAVSAAVDFGTTDPVLTFNAAGTYAVRARVKVALNGATFAANRTLTLKLRRTNNTAADLANSTTTYIVPVVTTITNTLAIIDLPEVLYTTALTNDTVTIFSDISVVPTAGTISIDEASIVAVRLS